MGNEWNPNLLLIKAKYNTPTRRNPNPKICPWGIVDKSKCVLPCVLFDTIYCTRILYSHPQEKTAKEWYNLYRKLILKENEELNDAK